MDDGNVDDINEYDSSIKAIIMVIVIYSNGYDKTSIVHFIIINVVAIF